MDIMCGAALRTLFDEGGAPSYLASYYDWEEAFVRRWKAPKHPRMGREVAARLGLLGRRVNIHEAGRAFVEQDFEFDMQEPHQRDLMVRMQADIDKLQPVFEDPETPEDREKAFRQMDRIDRVGRPESKVFDMGARPESEAWRERTD